MKPDQATDKRRKRAPSKRSLATRERVLDAAELVFAHRGFDGATIRDIAAEAGSLSARSTITVAAKRRCFTRLWRAAPRPCRAHVCNRWNRRRAAAHCPCMEFWTPLCGLSLPCRKMSRGGGTMHVWLLSCRSMTVGGKSPGNVSIRPPRFLSRKSCCNCRMRPDSRSPKALFFLFRPCSRC